MKNKVKVSTKSKLKYVDDNMLEVRFSFLVIRVDSIVEKFGSVDNFPTGNLPGSTNGKLVVIYEMMEPPPILYKLADKVLKPAGLKEYEDYVIAFEQISTFHVSRYYPSNINHPIPICDQAQWLGSIVSDIGNFVWDKNDETVRIKPRTFEQTINGVNVVGEFVNREEKIMSVRLISPFIGWEVEKSFTPWIYRCFKMDYMTVRAEIEAKEIIRDMYKKIVEIDNNLDYITKSYYEMQEELFILNEINPSKIQERAKEKLESYFYRHSLFPDSDEPIWGSSMDRRAIEKIIVTYRETNKRIYLTEQEK